MNSVDIFKVPTVESVLMPPKNKATSRSAKKGKGAKNSRIAADYESDPTSGDDEPPTNRVARRSARKRKVAKKSRVAAEQDSDLTSGDDQPEMCKML